MGRSLVHGWTEVINMERRKEWGVPLEKATIKNKKTEHDDVGKGGYECVSGWRRERENRHVRTDNSKLDLRTPSTLYRMTILNTLTFDR